MTEKLNNNNKWISVDFFYKNICTVCGIILHLQRVKGIADLGISIIVFRNKQT